MSRHQRGYIFEAHGSFRVRYYVVENGDRKQKPHRLCTKDRATGHGSPSAKAVRQLCEDFMRTVNTEAPATPSLSVVTFWESTYLPFITTNLKHSTVLGYTQIWNQHLMGHFGSGLLKDYRTPMMSNFLTQLAKTLRPRTLSHIKNLASGLFAHAVATGNCDTNPIRDAQVLGRTLEHGTTEVYSLEEMENVISALVDRVDAQLVMALSFFAGMRKGEIQGLQWGDVDADFIHIRRAVVRGVIGTPKTLKSLRAVPLIGPVRVLFALWRGRSTSALWVFPNEAGNPICLKDQAARTIRPALEKAGVPWKGFHAGRRGLGTVLRVITGNSNAGRDMLGHSDDAVTQRHYEGQMPDEVLKAMKLLEAKVTKEVQPMSTQHQMKKQTVEIERLIVDGFTNTEIAKRFNISRERVRQIKKKMFEPISKRCENRIANEIEEDFFKKHVEFMAKRGGYLPLPK